MGVFFTEEQTSVDGEEMELGYPITCGDSKAVLLVKKFVCPGINVKCVKVCVRSLQNKKQLIDLPQLVLCSPIHCCYMYSLEEQMIFPVRVLSQS